MSLFKFNAEELKELAKGLAPVLIPMLQPKAELPPILEGTDDEGYTYSEVGKVIYTDPMVKVADETTERCMKALPTGVATYVGKSGTTVVNHSEESMNTVQNWKQNRGNWRTRQKIR
jgi:hypothetical protein